MHFPHFSRWGLLIPITFAVYAVAIITCFEHSIGLEAARELGWPDALMCLLPGLTFWLLRDVFPTRTKSVKMKIWPGRTWTLMERTNTFFFLSFRAWSYLLLTVALAHFGHWLYLAYMKSK